MAEKNKNAYPFNKRGKGVPRPMACVYAGPGMFNRDGFDRTKLPMRMVYAGPGFFKSSQEPAAPEDGTAENGTAENGTETEKPEGEFICKSCGAALEKRPKFCPECGSPMENDE